MRGQPTSAEALQQSEASGQLNGKRFEVARAFEKYGPGTSAEVLKAAGLDGNRNLMRARVTELADVGWLKPNPARKCFVTKRKAIVWSFERCEPRAEPPCKATKAELIALVRSLCDVAECCADAIDSYGGGDDESDSARDDARDTARRARRTIGDGK